VSIRGQVLALGRALLAVIAAKASCLRRDDEQKRPVACVAI
jgi:hypothetical protein